MSRIERIKKIGYQYRKPAQNKIDSEWEPSSYVEASQSVLNAQIPDDTITIEDSEMPTIFLKTILDWSAGEVNDTLVRIKKEYVYIIQDLTESNISERQYILTPNLGIGYFDISYYGGVL